MIAFLNWLFDAKVQPVTSRDVAPSERNEEKEAEIKIAVEDLVHAKFAVERRSWEIRQQLAGNVLRLVSGEI
jgi:hypothetical protein